MRGGAQAVEGQGQLGRPSPLGHKPVAPEQPVWAGLTATMAAMGRDHWKMPLRQRRSEVLSRWKGGRTAGQGSKVSGQKHEQLKHISDRVPGRP